ncbi:aminopeptidase P family protein [bacterium]|nr:aminopeptidase P family protein [bacterium]
MDSTALFGDSSAGAVVIIDKTEHNMDMYYLSNFFVPDPCAYILTRTQSALIVSDLEYGRACQEANVGEVFRVGHVPCAELTNGLKVSALSKSVIAYLMNHTVTKILVQETFPFRYAEELKANNIEIEYRTEPFIPLRACKSDCEIDAIQQAVQATEGTVEGAVAMIGAAKIKDGMLYLDDAPLTAERVKAHIAQKLISENLLALHTIVAGGIQGFDPHNRGSGMLPAHQPIILDVFPRSMDTFYFADMTRTVVKGDPDPHVVKMFDAVLDAFNRTVAQIKHGVAVKDIHAVACETLKKHGFESGMIDGLPQGFIHSTGHGVGLDIHEAPRLANTGDILQTGNVITVEPGLYYQAYGGVRLEDIVVVTETGCRNLNRLPKYLQV